MRLVVLATLALAAGALGVEPAGSAPEAARPLVVHTSVAPARSAFGDPVVAEVAVEFDPSVVAAASLELEPSFGPYVEISPPTLERAGAGGEDTIRFSYRLQCLSDGCLPGSTSRTVRFPRVTVNGRSGSSKLSVSVGWPQLTVSSRLIPAELRGTPRFRRAATLPAPAFGVPAALADLLIGVGVVLGLVAALLVVLEATAFRRRRTRSVLERRTPLERAIAFARQSAGRADPADRRKALSELASALDGTGATGLADAAGGAAWAEVPPSPARTIELADAAAPGREAGRA